MGENTTISWADDTWNPWEGCQKVSPACDGCYAEARNLRYAPKGSTEAPNWGPHAQRRRTSAANWKKPLKWDREVAALKRAWHAGPDGGMGRPYPYSRFVFCASLADVFDNAVPEGWRRDLFELIRATPNLTWLLLTKRPQNIVRLFVDCQPSGALNEILAAWPLNAAIGCTVVTQEEADRDVPILLGAKAAMDPAFAFVSMEPLLAPVDLTHLSTMRFRGAEVMNGLTGELTGIFGDPCIERLPGLDWVITGGETDQGKHKARPADPRWFRSLRDQCAAAGVPFHLKQMTRKAPVPADLQIQERPNVA